MILQQIPLDFDVFESTLAALTVFVSVTVFTTGFLSVGIHGERSRALDRAYLAEEHLAERIGTDHAISDRELNATYEALNSVRPTVARAVAYGNLLVFAAAAGLVIEWVHNAGWKWTSPIEARPSLLALLAILAIELAVVAVGIFDAEHVAHDLKKRKINTYGYRLLQISADLRDGQVVQAEGQAKRLSQEVPNAPATQRALGCTQLPEEDWCDALASFEKALTYVEKIPGSRDLVALMGKARALEALECRKEAAAALRVFVSMMEDDGLERSVIYPVKWQTWVDALEIVAKDVPNRTDSVMVWLLDHYRDDAAAMSATAAALPRVVHALDGHPGTVSVTLQRWSIRGESDELTRAVNELLQAPNKDAGR